MISIENVTVTAKNADGSDKIILDNINLTLNEQRIAIIGANGSGKSTLIRLLNGLVSPTSGRVILNLPEEEIDTAKNVSRARREVAFMFTNPLAGTIMPTPLEDVALSLKKQKMPKNESAELALRTLERFGLQEQRDQSIHSLSGGQAQLLALAAVIATGPRIVVADEPTTLLDLKNTKLVEKTLLELEQQLIVATHNLDFAAKMERVIVVNKGRIMFDGDPQEAVKAYKESA